MNPKKIGTAILYAAQTPIAVWAGFEFGMGRSLFGLLLTGIITAMEGGAAILWMDAQSEQTADLLQSRSATGQRCGDWRHSTAYHDEALHDGAEPQKESEKP